MSNKQINDNTSLYSKYKTIGELKKAPIKSYLNVISRMKPCEERIYLSKWIFENHYLKDNINFKGNLTNRIKPISNKCCYYHIINHCFSGIDPMDYCNTIPILNEKCKNIIKSLHKIDPRGNGIFIDYLIRRIISEISEETFNDNRANKFTNLDKLNINNNKQLWQFNSNNDIDVWRLCKTPDINSNTLNLIEDGDRFIELERKDEWLKIKYKKKIGYVRYLVPNVKITTNISGNIKEYIPNKWFKKIDKNNNDNHYCEMGCKTILYNLNRLNCKFPYCQNMCYLKVKDTKNFKTIDILKELYIVSICHSEAFGNIPSQDKLNNIIDILNIINKSDFIFPIINLCKKLILNSNKILLNPTLGSNNTPIPSDCDLVIDDILIDIKCTSNNKDISEILQLLGYSSILLNNNHYSMRINNICILNLLKCECKVYNIENITNNNLTEYFNLLINNYNKKKIYINSINKNIKYPDFINQL